MKWPDDFKRMKELSNQLGSPYAAAMYAAKQSRVLFDECHGVLKYGESVRCAIVNELPEDLDKRLQTAKEIAERREFTHVDEILSDVDDKEIRDAVYNSYRLSINAHHLEYDYKDIEDENVQARIRILTRMCYLKTSYM